MAEVKPGDVLVDNDPREHGREVVVESVSETHVACRARTGRLRRIRLDRIFDDGKKRQRGYSVKVKS